MCLDLPSRVSQNEPMKIALTIAALLLVGSARADDPQLPYFKEGLWQATTSHSFGGKSTQMILKICQNRDTQNKDRELSASLRKRSQCTYKISHPTPNTYVTEDQCPAGQPASKGTITFQGDKAYRLEMHRGAGSEQSVMIVDARYLGSCPADMKPGDVIMPDGTKSNVNGH
jgi:hypothetical protein